MSITVLHTADWQIGKPFGTMGEAAAFLKSQRIATIKTIANLATKRSVDAVLVSGDVFDDNAVSDKTIHQTINAMASYSGPWLLLPGNHDAAISESVWSRMRPLCSDNIHILDAPEPFTLQGGSAVILPAPLQRRHDTNDLTEWFDSYETGPEVIRIGLAHGSVANRLPERSESMNFISDRRSEQARLDYLALGDWHGTLEIAQRTWYSGTPEPDRFKSNDPGNVLLVRISAAGSAPEVEKISVRHYIWYQRELSVMGAQGIEGVNNTLEALGKPEDALIVQLILNGTIDLEQRSALNDVLTRWTARVQFLQCDDRQLLAEPSKDDLDQIGKTGFIGVAIEKLSRLIEDTKDPNSENARLALQLLYLEQKKLSGARK